MAETLKETLEETNAELETVEAKEIGRAHV